MPVYFITGAHVRAGGVTVTGPLRHHLHASLRTQAGEELWLAIPSQCRYRVRVTQIDRRRLSGEILEERAMPAQTRAQVELALAILKGDKMDWAVQKATELGVRSIVPLLSRRTIVRPHDGHAAKQRDRWRRVAFEAAQQAERWDVPFVGTPHPVAAYAGAAEPGTRLILCERAHGVGIQDVEMPADPTLTVALMVGPEGGWTTEEIDEALEQGWTPVTLGDRILRAETAALAALSLLQNRLGNLG